MSLRRADHSSRGILPRAVCLGVIVKPRKWWDPILLGAVAPWGKKIWSTYTVNILPQSYKVRTLNVIILVTGLPVQLWWHNWVIRAMTVVRYSHGCRPKTTSFQISWQKKIIVATKWRVYCATFLLFIRKYSVLISVSTQEVLLSKCFNLFPQCLKAMIGAVPNLT